MTDSGQHVSPLQGGGLNVILTKPHKRRVENFLLPFYQKITQNRGILSARPASDPASSPKLSTNYPHFDKLFHIFCFFAAKKRTFAESILILQFHKKIFSVEFAPPAKKSLTNARETDIIMWQTLKEQGVFVTKSPQGTKGGTRSESDEVVPVRDEKITI